MQNKNEAKWSFAENTLAEIKFTIVIHHVFIFNHYH